MRLVHFFLALHFQNIHAFLFRVFSLKLGSIQIHLLKIDLCSNKCLLLFESIAVNEASSEMHHRSSDASVLKQHLASISCIIDTEDEDATTSAAIFHFSTINDQPWLMLRSYQLPLASLCTKVLAAGSPLVHPPAIWSLIGPLCEHQRLEPFAAGSHCG